MLPQPPRICRRVSGLRSRTRREVRRLSAGRAFYALYERGVPVALQVYPLARRAFDFRRDQTPEERIAARHARERAKAWLVLWMKLSPEARCPGR